MCAGCIADRPQDSITSSSCFTQSFFVGARYCGLAIGGPRPGTSFAVRRGRVNDTARFHSSSAGNQNRSAPVLFLASYRAALYNGASQGRSLVSRRHPHFVIANNPALREKSRGSAHLSVLLSRSGQVALNST